MFKHFCPCNVAVSDLYDSKSKNKIAVVFFSKFPWLFIVLYRSPSQSQDNFETFSGNFEMTLETLAQKGSFQAKIIGNFNAKSCN